MLLWYSPTTITHTSKPPSSSLTPYSECSKPTLTAANNRNIVINNYSHYYRSTSESIHFLKKGLRFVSQEVTQQETNGLKRYILHLHRIRELKLLYTHYSPDRLLSLSMTVATLPPVLTRGWEMASCIVNVSVASTT